MKSAMKLLSAFLLAVFVFILISGIAVFTAFAFDYYHMREPLTLSAISEFFNAKSSATEVVENFECGMGLNNFNDIKEQDILECYIMEEVKR